MSVDGPGLLNMPTIMAFLTWFGGAGYIFTRTLGLSAIFAVPMAIVSGLTGGGIVLGIAAMASIWRIAICRRGESGWWVHERFAAYLVLIGVLSAGVFALGRCGTVSNVRYDLLSLLGATGLAAWYLAVERHLVFRRAAITVILAWSALSAVAHGRIWSEYLLHRPPVAAKTSIVQHLEARGIRYALSDYWIAYYVTFVTNERVIVAPDGFTRIAEYGQVLREHHAEAIHISRVPCGDVKPVIENVYFCGFE